MISISYYHEALIILNGPLAFHWDINPGSDGAWSNIAYSFISVALGHCLIIIESFGIGIIPI